MYSILQIQFLKGRTSWRFNLSQLFILCFPFLLTSIGLGAYLASNVPRSRTGIWLKINIPKLWPPTVYFVFTLYYKQCKSKAWFAIKTSLLSLNTWCPDIYPLQTSERLADLMQGIAPKCQLGGVSEGLLGFTRESQMNPNAQCEQQKHSQGYKVSA